MAATPDLQTLYRETVLDHSRSPRNFRRLGPASRHAEGHNPLCGDKVTIYLDLGAGLIEDASFVGSGCAISLASASMLTEMIKGKRLTEAEPVIESVTRMFGAGDGGAIPPDCGPIAALASVRAYPSRIRCATLAWQTLRAALNQSAVTATTK